jgi:hypothetical protein
MNIKKNTAAIVILANLFGTAHAVDAYVDQFISFKDASGANSIAYGNVSGNSTSWTLGVVDPALVTGAPTAGEWASLSTNYTAVYGFNMGLVAKTAINVFSVANGANEVASVFGRLNSSASWTLIGDVMEGGGVGLGYQTGTVSFASIAALSSGVGQVMIQSHGNAGGSPGFDLMGIQGTNMVAAPVPEPETYALMGLGLIALLANRRRKLDA